MSENLTNDFKFWYPATVEKGSDGKMWISGIASTEHEDLQGEVIKQNGLQLDYFLKRGFLNDDHSKETSGKVGIPTEAVITKKGLWIKGYLLDTPRAKGIWDLAQALSKSGDDRKLGYSVEGKVLARDSKNPRVITKAWIKDVAVTASPINPNTFLDIAKSFASTDCTDVFVVGEEEAVTKAQADELEALQQATKKPVAQIDKEKEDAEQTAKEALSDKKPKPELNKMMPDVPVAKRAGKSLVTLEIDDEGNIIIKGLKLPKKDPGIVDDDCKHCGKKNCGGHIELHGEDEDKTAKRVQMAAGDDDDKEAKLDKNATEVQKVKKAIGEKCETCDQKPSTGMHAGRAICNECKRDYVDHPIETKVYKKSESSEYVQKPVGCAVPKCQGTYSEGDSYCTAGHSVSSAKTRLKNNNFGRASEIAPSTPLGMYKKSESEVDLEKGFKVVSSIGGEQDQGSKKIPVHTITYGHKSGHHMQVSGKEGNFVVVHSHKNGKDAENLGCAFFVDDPKKGKKGKEDVDEYLKGFGIKHKFADKDKLMGKSLEFAKQSEQCEICKSEIAAGSALVKSDGKQFCDDRCIEKAMVSGYSFGVTDQANGGALRVESLEGSQKDLSYGKYVLDTKVKDVKFDTARANGGSAQVTLKDAIEFLTSKGLPQDLADRVLVLMVKNNGDITKLAQRAKGGK
jgi:hypothetical protein